MSYPKLLALTSKLANATASSLIKWAETEENGVFQASFSDNSVRVSERQSRTHRGSIEYVLSIFNSNGELVEELGDEDVGDEVDRAEMYCKFKDMYEAARRQAKGVDQVIDEILRDLGD